MSDTEKRPPTDWAALAAAMRKITGAPIDEHPTKPISKIHAVEAVEKALAFLNKSGAGWTAPSDDIFKYTSMALDDIFIKYQSPFSGAVVLNNYVLEVWCDSEVVLLAKWNYDDDDYRDIYTYRPGLWLEKL